MPESSKKSLLIQSSKMHSGEYSHSQWEWKDVAKIGLFVVGGIAIGTGIGIIGLGGIALFNVGSRFFGAGARQSADGSPSFALDTYQNPIPTSPYSVNMLALADSIGTKIDELPEEDTFTPAIADSGEEVHDDLLDSKDTLAHKTAPKQERALIEQTLFLKTMVTSSGSGTAIQQPSLYVTPDGTIFVTGSTYECLDKGNGDMFFMRFDKHGNVVWSNSIGDASRNDGQTAITMSVDGSKLYAVVPIGGWDTGVICVDPANGNILWKKLLSSGLDYENGLSIQSTANGNICITGQVGSYADGNVDIFLAQLNGDNGLPVWSKTFGGNMTDVGRSLKTTTNDTIYLVGTTQSFGTGNKDIILMRFASTGNLMWAKTFGGSGSDEGFTITEGPDNCIYIAGRTSSFGALNYQFILKINHDGNLLWAKTLGEYGTFSIQSTPNGLYLFGYHELGGSNARPAVFQLSHNGDLIAANLFSDYPTYSRESDSYTITVERPNPYMLVSYNGRNLQFGNIFLASLDPDGFIPGCASIQPVASPVLQDVTAQVNSTNISTSHLKTASFSTLTWSTPTIAPCNQTWSTQCEHSTNFSVSSSLPLPQSSSQASSQNSHQKTSQDTSSPSSTVVQSSDKKSSDKQESGNIGLKVGIAIGAAAVGTSAAALIAYGIWRQRRAQNAGRPVELVPTSATYLPGDPPQAKIKAKEVQESDIQLIGEPLGKGSYGTVYKASWNGSIVAVKMLPLHLTALIPDFEQEFQKEARIMKKARHPNVLNFFGFYKTAQHFCIVMELVDQGTFGKYIHSATYDPMVNLEKTLTMLIGISAGMAFLHDSLGIIHRDLKPDNILIDAGGKPKIADFGTSKLSNKALELQERQQTKGVGTPIYMAPESLAKAVYSDRSDVYSFGVMLWEALTKKVPYETWDVPGWELSSKICRGDRETIPTHIPSELATLIQQCWAQNPNERPTMMEVTTRLSQILEHLFPAMVSTSASVLVPRPTPAPAPVAVPPTSSMSMAV